MYVKGEKENVCGKDKTIYTLNGEKFIKQIGKKGDVYVSLEKYIKKKKDKGECLNPIADKRLAILNKIFKKSSSVKPVLRTSSSQRRASEARRASSSRRRASAARRASSSRRRAIEARRASSSRRRASAARRASSSRRRASAARRANAARRTSSSFKLSNGLVRSPLLIAQPARRFTLSNTKKSKNSASLGKKPCKKDCVKDDKICNYSSGRCVKPKKEKNVIVKKVPLDKIGVRPCKQDCTAINKICKISTRRCVNPPKQKPIITGKNIKPCKKDCAKDYKICNFSSGRCIKQKN